MLGTWGCHGFRMTRTPVIIARLSSVTSTYTLLLKTLVLKCSFVRLPLPLDEDRRYIIFLVIMNKWFSAERTLLVPLFLSQICGLVRDGLGGHSWSRGAPGFQWLEARVATQHPTPHRTAPSSRQSIFQSKASTVPRLKPHHKLTIFFPKGFDALSVVIYIVSKPICLFKQMILRPPKKEYKWNYSHISSMTSLWELLFPLLVYISNF